VGVRYGGAPHSGMRWGSDRGRGSWQDNDPGPVGTSGSERCWHTLRGSRARLGWVARSDSAVKVGDWGADLWTRGYSVG
jgi:hypothetical protein